MTVKWNTHLSTGVDWQDRHHMELFKRVNLLLDAMGAGLGAEEVERLLSFLDSYVVVHFSAEEEALRSCSCPEADAHMAEHEAFRADMARLRAAFEKAPSSGLVVQIQRRVVDWLVDHIGGKDKVLGERIVEAERQGPQAR